MSEELEKAKYGAGLWARARPGWRDTAAAPEAPDPLTLAAYLDDTLEEAAQERVEAWMAASPEALDLVIALREAGLREAGAREAVPESLLARAQGLVRERPRPARAGLAAWLGGSFSFQMAAWRPVAWAGVTAVLLLVSTGGFELGRQGALQIVDFQTASADDLDFGLSDPAEELL